MDTDLVYEVLSVVEEIPEGRVATYGQIARLTGRDRNARLVGRILGMSEYYGQFPCHRVVNHAGRTAPGFYDQRQRQLLIFKLLTTDERENNRHEGLQ